MHFTHNGNAVSVSCRRCFMELQLRDKVALVTGSTAGIGLAIAKSLDAEGAKVIVNGRTEERVESAKRNLGPRAQGVVADLSTESGAEKLMREIPKVDILINNFGVFEAKEASALSREDFEEMFTLNVLSGVSLSQKYLPQMLAQDWGRIVFIASETGANIPKDMIHYGVSKAAQIALARGLAETTAGTQVTVNSILPGPTLSEGVEKFLASLPTTNREEFIEKLRPTSLLKRFATAEEVANLVTYVASPRSSATNGASLRVEGGLLRGIF